MSFLQEDHLSLYAEVKSYWPRREDEGEGMGKVLPL
jgi:hypothetical protein